VKECYEKPRFVIEHFGLTQTIAQGCSYNKNTSTLGHPTNLRKSSCAWDVGGVTFFFDSAKGCEDVVEEDGEITGICYNNPNGGVTIFHS